MKLKDWSIKLWCAFLDSKFVRLLAFVFIVAGVIAIAYRITGFSFLYKPQAELPRIVKVENRTSDIELRMVKWVFDHSTRTSKRTAKEWVDESLKTNKPLLILALTMQEGEFNPTAVSDKGAKGGTQVMWKYWGPELIKAGICNEERDLFNIDVAVKAGNFVLDVCLKQGGGDITKSLVAYLGGRDGYYKNRITDNLANLYVLVNSPVDPVSEKKEEVKKTEVPKK